jgi:7-carboxy-7-deazaguanine synthase (Cx14CxxC type)
MSYAIKEIFYSLQGEGRQTGRPAVFVRFTGCNLWSGREEHRETAVCSFCDTDFVGTDGSLGGRYEAAELAATATSTWAGRGGRPLAICTGGEPALQLDGPLIAALRGVGFEIAVETNGTRALPECLDWICVSPKAGTEIVVRSGDELKVVFPQGGLDLEALESLDFRHFSLQPMDGPRVADHLRACVQTVLDRPHWSLSLQTHKLLGIR